MTPDAVAVPTPVSVPVAADERPAGPSSAAAASFVRHAKLVGGLTLLSRVFGLGREVVAGHYLGTALVGSAFTVAFVVPNLFRKLFGEGALSAAFIPLYARAVREGDADEADAFAAAAVNLLVLILVGLTVAGEAVVLGLVAFGHGRYLRETELTLRLTAVMLPYVVLICGGAFLSGILQVHRRFGPPAAAPILLNACHIVVLLIGARLLGLGRSTPAARVVPAQTTLAYALAAAVLVAGGLQVAVLLPGLRAVGFRFRRAAFWTPAVRRMLALSLPVALGAGVLQLSVLLDKGLSMALMRGVDAAGHAVTGFRLLGRTLPLPLALGAPRRLDLAQFLYQFPLGVFAIALATAIFPGLSAEAAEQSRDRFRAVLRHGIEASLWEGLPASLGLVIVAGPAARLLFQHGQVSGDDAALIARSAAVYGSAIWAFSLLQIVNRAYYALHDMRTPLAMSATNLVVNLAVEVPLLWWLGEAGMAVGTVVSFALQAVAMLWMLDRKVGGLGLRHVGPAAAKMLLATAAMGLACAAVRHSPLYPTAASRPAWAAQLALMLGVGAGVYLATCRATGVNTMDDLFGQRRRRPARV